MIEAFNALLESLVTGLFCALWLLFFGFIGLMPITIMVTRDQIKDFEDDDDEA